MNWVASFHKFADKVDSPKVDQTSVLANLLGMLTATNPTVFEEYDDLDEEFGAEREGLNDGKPSNKRGSKKRKVTSNNK